MLNFQWGLFLRWCVLFVLALIVYGQTFSFGFVFDDHEFILNNPYIKHFDQIDGIWNSLPKTRLVGIYSFALNYWMNQFNPQGYHIFNFVVHLLATGLVWLLGGLLFKVCAIKFHDHFEREIPFIIALIFLVHPGQTQAVSYISQRFESMATVFYLGTICCYLQARLLPLGFKQNIWFCLSGGLAILGALTKETVATVPIMILVVEWLFLRQNKRLWYWGVLIIAGILFSALFMHLVRAGPGVFTQTTLSESHDGDVLTPVNYFLTQMRVFCTFLRLLIMPVYQNLDYDYPMSTGLLSSPVILLGIGLVTGFIALIVRLKRTLPLVSFGLAWVLITFSINLAPRVNFIFEHKLYLMSFGFIVAGVIVLFRFIRHRVLLLGILIGIITVLSILSFKRNHVWQNGITLWSDTVHKSPHKHRPNANLGLAYSRLGQYDLALQFLNKAILMKPNQYNDYANRGEVYYQLSRDDDALADFNQAIILKPMSHQVYFSRGKVYKRKKDNLAAFIDFDHSISIKPTIDAYIERGLLFMANGRVQKALEDMNSALEMDSHDYSALVNRAGIFFCDQQYERAVQDLNEAQQINPYDARLYKNRAYSLLALGKNSQALEDIKESLRLNPDDAQLRAKRDAILGGY